MMKDLLPVFQGGTVPVGHVHYHPPEVEAVKHIIMTSR